ncbi:uncharacterized protein J8A68_001336 [[Candida] subhashii]|uniref:WD40 repeat-like protein n=1 Tax=[Candida] subhashii TaxID=561895 RepID=A0A8J5QSD2_9ASCO|nr:uncharacterized protein J8A68_001336 [[Candida] subhashii]KAG7665280.1 hypothetical protein J8A68_001336 [[Candida] subhashii]
MDWYNNRSKRSSISTGAPSYSPASYGIMSTTTSGTTSSSSKHPTGGGPHSPFSQQRAQFQSSSSSANQIPQLIKTGMMPSGSTPTSTTNNNLLSTPPIPTSTSPSLMTTSNTTPLERNSYYFSQYPLFATDWTCLSGTDIDCIALGTYKEGFTNKLEIVHGVSYEHEYNRRVAAAAAAAGISGGSAASGSMSTTSSSINNDIMDNVSSPGGTLISQDMSYIGTGQQHYFDDDIVEGFYFQRVADISIDYPVTHLQWDPQMLKNGGGTNGGERLAASSEVLRLYKLNQDEETEKYSLVQTHTLANNTTSSCTSSANSLSMSSSSQKPSTTEDVNTYPPVTSFDWNKIDPNILITSSVDTTCTVWDLHRSHPRDDLTDTATVKTQLIAHDSEVFDVKFIHKSTNVFASVGNDGSMRVFDLRSLEHSTIIYEPPALSTTTSTSTTNTSSNWNSKALISLSTSNIDQHHLATIGINSNQVIIIDMRMPGLPVVTLDGSLGGINHASINSIKYHPSSNYLLTGGDDCQALVWDCNSLKSATTPTTTTATPTNNDASNNGSSSGGGSIIDMPVLAYEEDLEVNNVCWRGERGDWMGVVSGKGFQAVSI